MEIMPIIWSKTKRRAYKREMGKLQAREDFKKKYKTHKIAKENNKRNCTKCGRMIPFDAYLCPYCGKNFQEGEGSKPKSEDKKTYVDKYG